MFVDRVEILCQAGDGGNGCLSFRREAHVPRGGPDGGDGGDGGSVIIQVDANVGSLANIVGHRHWKAGKGRPGEGKLMSGRGGDDVYILVSPGTVVKDIEHGFIIKEMLKDGETLLIAQGGRGGRGNKHYATSTDRAPRQFEEGTLGESREVQLELKVIADVGLIGKPNAGKSTLLSRLSRANPEIAAYPFTTKYPNLGMVRVGYDHQFVVADIPGLIEGAHEGVGLGHEFLKHVQRTRLFVHLVEPAPMDQTDPIDNYIQICKEIHLYDETLDSRPVIVVVTKCELPDAEACAELLAEEIGRDVLQISAVTGEGLAELVRQIVEQLQEIEGTDLF